MCHLLNLAYSLKVQRFLTSPYPPAIAIFLKCMGTFDEERVLSCKSLRHLPSIHGPGFSPNDQAVCLLGVALVRPFYLTVTDQIQTKFQVVDVLLSVTENVVPDNGIGENVPLRMMCHCLLEFGGLKSRWEVPDVGRRTL